MVLILIGLGVFSPELGPFEYHPVGGAVPRRERVGIGGRDMAAVIGGRREIIAAIGGTVAEVRYRTLLEFHPVPLVVRTPTTAVVMSVVAAAAIISLLFLAPAMLAVLPLARW